VDRRSRGVFNGSGDGAHDLVLAVGAGLIALPGEP
jgi:hypothetical protein